MSVATNRHWFAITCHMFPNLRFQRLWPIFRNFASVKSSILNDQFDFPVTGQKRSIGNLPSFGRSFSYIESRASSQKWSDNSTSVWLLMPEFSVSYQKRRGYWSKSGPQKLQIPSGNKTACFCYNTGLDFLGKTHTSCEAGTCRIYIIRRVSIS